MRFPLSALLCLPLAAGAPAQTPIEAIQSVFDEVARGLNYVGRKAGGLLPGLGIGEEVQAAHTELRPFSERLPVGPAPLISIANEFGRVRVSAWDERVVQVNAEVKVGAESPELAAELARAIDLNITPGENLVEIRTFLPDTRKESGLVTMEVNYDITVPSGASLVSDNFFGDTVVRGLSGLVAVESQYGLVELSALSGEVKARTHGEFPLRVSGLAQGGVFDLNGAHAEFANVGGRLRVMNFRGSVRVQDLADGAFAEITSDNGPVTVVLPPEAEPDLTVNAVYGNLESSLPMSRSSQGRKLVARYPTADAAQRIVVSAAFGDVRVERRTPEGAPVEAPQGDAKPFTGALARSGVPVPGSSLRIEAMPGDIRLQGVDGDEVRVSATRVAWVPNAARAPGALEALDIEAVQEEGVFVLRSLARRDKAEVDARDWRIDWLVECPRGMAVSVQAESGTTHASDLSGAVRLAQVSGSVQAGQVLGPLHLSNQRGDIQVQRASGPVEASVRYGTLLLQEVAGPITAESDEGQIVIDAPRGPVTARGRRGDVRILALEGVGGAYDVRAEAGTLSLVLAPNANAALHLSTERGAVHSGIPLDGGITRNTQEFRGRLGEGAHPVRLHAQDGDILLD
jgi:hypothetical protein